VRRPTVEIGDADGRIALYLNERSAIDLAYLLHSDDLGHRELLDAVEKAYPDTEDEGLGLGIRLGMGEHGPTMRVVDLREEANERRAASPVSPLVEGAKEE
jgi:hypothetical protein